MKVEHATITALQPYAGNARLHPKKQVRQIAESIKAFGFNVPVLVDAGNGIIAGHGRVEAARLLGLSDVPVIRVDHLTETQKKAFILADNKIAAGSRWDQKALSVELESLLDLEFDVSLTGFETPEIDIILNGDPAEEDEEFVVEDVPGVVVSQLGDLWRLGEHRLLCGDARDPEAYSALMDGEKAQMAFTDPPYNVKIDGHVCGAGKVHHDEFVMASGEMSEAEFTQFLGQVFGNMASHSADGTLQYICTDWRHLPEMLSAGRDGFTEFKNLCVWNKDNGGMGSLYRSKHELVLVFKAGREPHINNIELGRHGRYRTNVWDYPGINSMGKSRMALLKLHPTVKPVRLVADAICDASHRDGIILDPFAGSGTIFLAAERTGRKARGMELLPAYVDTAIRRWERISGQKAVHAITGMTMEEIKTTRQGEHDHG